MAIPGVFAPVTIGGRLLLDGAIVDLMPYEHILDRCDVTIGVNVAGTRTPKKPGKWNDLDSFMVSLDIMQGATLSEKMNRRHPDLYVHPDIPDVPWLDFRHAARVLSQAAPAIEAMKRSIEELLA